ncbi:reverse transcriptase [Phytophthora megakarya]|uniref:Reverse transcriptase n=1 Tax=Phytophthora megakarya TaxID=4795 RepID=A0A225V6W3_9STRA|nr:reverse transcriptase [Phytophthora megakarya]
MSGSVWIAKLEKSDPGFRANRWVTFKRLIHSRSSLWIISPDCPAPIKVTLNYLFSRYVIAKASGSRTAQSVAESYEECVFCRFCASEIIRHDREPGFMPDFFCAFSKILDQRQRWRIDLRRTDPRKDGTDYHNRT